MIRLAIAASVLLHAALLAALIAWPHPPPAEPDEMPGLEVILGPTQAPGTTAAPPSPPPLPPLPPAERMTEPQPEPAERAARPPDPAPQPPPPQPLSPVPNADGELPLVTEAPPPPERAAAPPEPPPPEPRPPEPPRQAAVTAPPPAPPVVRSPLGQELSALLPDDPGTETEGELLPARPAPGVRNPPLLYPPAAYQRGQQGAVGVRIRVDADGSVLRLELVESSGYPLLDNTVLEGLRKWRFAPALQDGRPVAADLLYRAIFRLD